MARYLKRGWAPFWLIVAAGAARADDFEVEADQVLVTVETRIDGKLTSGVSRSLEWSAFSLEDGAAQMHLSIPLDSFAADGPQLSRLLHGPDAIDLEGTVSEGRFSGFLTLHALAHPIEMPFALTRSRTQLIAHTAFSFAPREFGIDMPGEVSVDFLARLHASAPAVLSGGVRSGR